MKQLALARLQVEGTDKLVFQRRDDQAPTSRNMLGFFGGHLDNPDENPAFAVVRELGEETSLAVSKLALSHIVTLDLPLGLHVATERTRVFLYGATIPNANFEVFEGVGNESYSRQDALNRNDLAATVRYILEREL